MTTIVGIYTPEGIVLASDTLKVHQNICAGKVSITKYKMPARKLLSSADSSYLIGYAYLATPSFAPILEEDIREILATCPTKKLPEKFRNRVSTIMCADSLVSLQDYRCMGSEFSALIASAVDNKLKLNYQYSAHPWKPVRNYKAIGSGQEFVKPRLRKCDKLDEAIEIAREAVKKACENKSALSQGLNISVMTLSGIEEIC